MNSYNVKDLAEYMKQAKKKGQPFVLFTGAGCSKSAGMPLASELVAEINEKYKLDLKALSEEEKLDYGRCMSALTKDDRRDLLQGYIKKANINWAHIVQALLLEQEYIQRVFTFNFDNILARSCGLIGLYPSTYDFTVANFDLLDLIINPAIVHLHGQSHGFAQLNTDKETNLHADRLSQFIATTLSQSPSLFIGYSGQADAFFPLLKDKFSDQKKLFWIGRDKIAPKHINDSLIIPNNAAHYLHHSDADRFFIELAQELECFPPLVFNDPFGYLLKQFDSILDFPASENIELDILTSTRLNLKKAQQLEIDSKKPNLEGLFMEGKYEELVKQAEDIELTDEEKLSVAWSFIMMANGLANEAEKEDNKERKIKLFYQSIEIYKKALEIKCDMPEALNNIGLSYFNLAKIKNSDELFKLSIDKYQQILNIIPSYYEAIDNWGLNLLCQYNLNKDPVILEKAKKILLKYKLLSKKANYNLACLYALENDKVNCKQELLDCLKINILPNKDFLDKDKDLDLIREDEWFKDFMNNKLLNNV